MSFLEKLSQHRLIPLFYHNDIEVCKRVIDAVINSNLPILEFTNRGSKAIQNFEYLHKIFEKYYLWNIFIFSN